MAIFILLDHGAGRFRLNKPSSAERSSTCNHALHKDLVQVDLAGPGAQAPRRARHLEKFQLGCWANFHCEVRWISSG